MNCPKKDKILELFTAEPPPEKEELLKHIQHCSDCAADYNFYFNLSKELKSAKSVDPPSSLKNRILNKVSGLSQPARFPSIVLRRALATAGFAALILAFAINLTHIKSQEAETKAVNEYLLKITHYLKSDTTWAEPFDNFGNF
jgi:hypothetical protein